MYEKLFEPGKIGTMQVPNRLVMTPMLTIYANGKYVSDRLINYYAARARGGFGLVIVELAVVEPLGAIVPNQIGLYDDDCIDGLSRLAEAIHAHGAKVGLQIGHGGHRAWSRYIYAQPVSASDVQGRGGEVPRPMTHDEIKRLVESFVKAALRVKKSGIDGVEVHCAHGYLLRQFLSAYSNKRTDEYGGDLEGRARLPVEIVGSIRQSVGSYPVWVRVNGDDFVEDGGNGPEDNRKVSQWLEKAGADAISVSAGTNESPFPYSMAPMFLPRGLLLPLSDGIKKVVKVPVMVVSRVDTPEFAEKILDDGKADFVGIGRASIADPDFGIKAKEGRAEDIRRCIADNECLDGHGPEGCVDCTVNASVGKEKEHEISPATEPKRILIVGGGPAGMESARVAALRGHKVTLCEKSSVLGGQINVASKGCFKDGMDCITGFLSSQIAGLGVKVELNTEVTESLVNKLNPDVVIIATGAEPLILHIPGIDQDNVVTAHDVLLGKSKPGEKVVIIGGGRVGVETAEFLKEKGHDVTILEMLGKIGSDIGHTMRFATLTKLREMGVKMLTQTRAVKLEGRKLVVDKQGTQDTLVADTVVLAAGARPNTSMDNMARKANVYRIGDCVKPRNIKQAIGEGADLARKI